MRISAPVELNLSRGACLLHQWEVESRGRDVEEEVYTCALCGASWQRTISYNGHGGHDPVPVMEWPTWEEIIAEP